MNVHWTEFLSSDRPKSAVVFPPVGTRTRESTRLSEELLAEFGIEYMFGDLFQIDWRGFRETVSSELLMMLLMESVWKAR